MGGKKKEPEPHKIFVMTTVLRSLESERPISQKYQAQRNILKSKFKELRIKELSSVIKLPGDKHVF